MLHAAFHLVEPLSSSPVSTCFPLLTSCHFAHLHSVMADDFQTYKSKSSRKRKADQMDVDVSEDVSDGKKRVEFKAIASHVIEQQVSRILAIACTSSVCSRKGSGVPV